jgi:pyridoxamine 5'-phosphate oxidase
MPEKAMLSEATVENDPIAQFASWYAEACAVEVPLPQAVALATATPSGRSSLRMVLLKDFDARGFVFYTNYRSRKAGELARNPRASLLFHWKRLERQVRIEGRVGRVSRKESDEYFKTRARGSQLGAWASPQSAVLADRADLDHRIEAADVKFPHHVPRPAYWGGYRLVPVLIEFWQGREDRLHDRLCFMLGRSGRWRLERLAP